MAQEFWLHFVKLDLPGRVETQPVQQDRLVIVRILYASAANLPNLFRGQDHFNHPDLGDLIWKMIERELGIPAIVLEGDHCDPRRVSVLKLETRIQVFMEMLAARREIAAYDRTSG